LKVGGGSLVLFEMAPGLHSLLCGIVFPVGLSMIVLTGVDLLTSNMMYATLPFLSIKNAFQNTQLIVDVNRFVSISFLGNLTGCLLFAAITSTAFGYGSIATFAISIAVAKTSAPWLVLLWKGIFANWLVNLAIVMSSSTSNNLAKLASLWIPITTFVTIGFEHSVANMFLIPFGILSGAPVLWSHFFFW